MAKPSGPSTKQKLIDKANTRIVIYVGVAAFVLVFSLVATKTLISQATYQNRIIAAKRTAVKQLNTNIAATKDLKNHYQAFITTQQNVLGGNTAGTGPKDGSNAKIVLDALPSGYDFPGLSASLETLLNIHNVKINSIAGTDDEVAQSANQTSANPQAVPIPFTVSIGSDYTGVQQVVSVLENSIRPMQIETLDISGTQNQLTLNMTAQTVYQSAKSLSITKVVIK